MLYFEIKKAIKYDNATKFAGLDVFVNNLPVHLRLEVSGEMYRDNFSKYDLFSKIGGKHFAKWVGSHLKPNLMTESSFFYREGDIIDNFYFGLKGVSAFIIPRINEYDQIFTVIDPENYYLGKEKKITVMQHFGVEDSVVNHAAIISDKKRETAETKTNFTFYRNGF